MHVDIERDVSELLRNQASIMINGIKERMLEDASDVMDRFYSDYRPKLYYRTDNLKNSYRGYVKKLGGGSTGFKRLYAL